MDPFPIGQGDRLPSIRETLIEKDGTVIDLTGATVVFRLLRNDILIFESPAVVEGTPTLGGARYDWDDGDTAASGIFDSEWIITFADGREQTFPPDRYNRVVVRPRRLPTGGSITPPTPKKYQTWDTVDTVVALKALPTVSCLAGKTFIVVRESNRVARLDGTSGLAEDLNNGPFATADNPLLQWFYF